MNITTSGKKPMPICVLPSSIVLQPPTPPPPLVARQQVSETRTWAAGVDVSVAMMLLEIGVNPFITAFEVHLSDTSGFLQQTDRNGNFDEGLNPFNWTSNAKEPLNSALKFKGVGSSIVVKINGVCDV